MKTGEPHGGTYVVCLECGKQFGYDIKEMRIGKAIDRSPDVGVLPPNMPRPPRTKLGYTLLAFVPAAVLFGAALHGRKQRGGDAGGSATGGGGGSERKQNLK